MLRLNPAHPPLWRSINRLQLGQEAVVVLDDPQPWQQRLLHELGRGIPDSALEPLAEAYGAEPLQVRDLLTRIRPALEHPPGAPPARITMAVPATFPAADASVIIQALSARGTRVQRVSCDDIRADPGPRGETVVLLAHHVIDPRDAAALLREDVAHFPIVLTGTRAVLGPLVRPGTTACLECAALHRTDADPAWPAIAAQLLGRQLPAVGAAFASEIGLAAGRLLSEPETARRIAHSLTLHVDSVRRSWRAHPPHAECRCRSLAGTATASEQPVRARATTTPTALARPA